MSSELLKRRVLHANMLGSEAAYRVLGDARGIVTAEVIHAPGLEPRMRVRLTSRAARSMALVDRPAARPKASPRRHRLHVGHV